MSERTYRLPCPCGRMVQAVPEQAGTELTCPQCGATVKVPSLQGLRKLESVPQGPPQTPAAPSRSRSPWPILALGATALAVVALVVWLVMASGERAAPQPGAGRLADSPLTPARRPQPATAQQAPPAGAPADRVSGQAKAERSDIPSERSDRASDEASELVPVEYVDLVDLGTLTHSREPVGAVLVKLARLVETHTPQARGLAQRMAQAYQVHLIGEQLELPDRRLGEQQRARLLAGRLRDRVQEETVLQAAVDETRQGLNRMVEIATALDTPQGVREIGVENFRRRIEQQHEQLSDPAAFSEMSEADQELAVQRRDRLEQLLALSDDDLIPQYAHWIFREGWVERSAEQVRDQHRRLSDRFRVSADEAEKLLEGNDQAFRDWMSEQRPAMIRRDLKTIVAMHGRLLRGDLDDAGQEQLRNLCVRWNVDPTEAPVLLRAGSDPLIEELDRRAARRIREELVMWLSTLTGEAATLPPGFPTLKEVAQRYDVEPNLIQIRELADASPDAWLERHGSIALNSWRRALEQLVELERTVLDTERLQSASVADAGAAFREYLEHNVKSSEALLERPHLPEALRPELEKVINQLHALLEQDDANLLNACDQAVQLHILPGTSAELLDELARLEQLLECDRAKAQRLLEAEDQGELKQLARGFAVRRLREELGVLAQGGAGSGEGGAGLRQAMIEKYEIRGAEARGLLGLPDDELWQWNLNRLAELSQLPDQEVVARAEQLLPGPAQELVEDSLEELGQHQREEIQAQLDALKQQFSASLAEAERATPWSIKDPDQLAEQERLQRGYLQPFLQPYSQYLWDALAATLGDEASDEPSGPETDLATRFAQGEPAPAWVGLLRNGLLQARFVAARDETPARLTLFLPVEAHSLSDPEAPKRAWDRWYGIARLMVRWLLRNEAAGGAVVVRAFAYCNEYETCTLWLNAEPVELELADAPPPPGKRSLDLESWREFLAESRLEGLRIADADSDPQLVLIGRRLSDQGQGEQAQDDPAEPIAAVRPFTLMGRPVEAQDLAVAYRAVFYGGHNEPFQSLDESRHPAVANANFGGDLEDTKLGRVLFDADLTFKFLTSGLDPYTNESLDRREEFQQICQLHGVPPFQPVYDQFVNVAEGAEMLQVTRFWLKLSGGSDDAGGAGVRFDWRASPVGVEVVQPFFLAEARKHVADGRELPVSDLPPWTRRAIDHLNQHREAYEELYPVLEEVRSVGLVLALCHWMKSEAVDRTFDLDELLDEPTTFEATPRTRLRGVFASVVNEQGTVESFNCADVVRALESRPLEHVPAKHFENFAYVAAASLALARKWEPESATVGQAYQAIYSRVMDAMTGLDRLTETEAAQRIEQLRGELYNVPQQRWTVGCAWTSTGGIDLALPPARRGRLDLTGRHSSRRRSGKAAPSRSRKTTKADAQTKKSSETGSDKPGESAKQSANPRSAASAKPSKSPQAGAERAKKPELKVERRGKRIRLQRRTGSRFSNDF